MAGVKPSLRWLGHSAPWTCRRATSDPRPIIDPVPRPWDTVHGWMSDRAIVSEADAVRERRSQRFGTGERRPSYSGSGIGR